MGGLVKAANNRLLRHVSPRARKRIAAVLPGRALESYRRGRTDAYLVSFPKCGRTWLKVMTGRALQLHFDLPPDANLVELHRLAELDPRVPCIQATHDDDAQWLRPEDVSTDKERFRGERVILLVRDPRDVVVSLYHQKRSRRGAYDGSLDDFVAEPVGGFESLLRFYDAWAASLDVPSEVVVVRYEDLHLDPASSLRRVLALVGVVDVSDESVAAAVAFASFDNMRALEERDAFGSEKLRPVVAGDASSYKTRRGAVGGFRDELSPAQVDRLDRLMAASSASAFGYQP